MTTAPRGGPPPTTRPAPHNARPATKSRIVTLVDGRVEGVEVYVEYRPGPRVAARHGEGSLPQQVVVDSGVVRIVSLLRGESEPAGGAPAGRNRSRGRGRNAGDFRRSSDRRRRK